MSTGLYNKQWIRWDRLQLVLDPWAGVGATAAALGSLCPVVLSDAVQRTSRLAALANAVEPGDMDRVVRAFGQPDAVVASPFYALDDLALTSAIALAPAVVLLHVPGHFVLDAQPARQDLFFARLASEQRVVLLTGLPRNVALGTRLIWLAVFASAAERERLLRPGGADLIVRVGSPPAAVRLIGALPALPGWLLGGELDAGAVVVSSSQEERPEGVGVSSASGQSMVVEAGSLASSGAGKGPKARGRMRRGRTRV